MKTKSYSIKENFDKEIVEIWEEIKNIDHLKKYYERGYCLPEEILENSTLILGINPSYNENHFIENQLTHYYQNNHNIQVEKSIPFFERMKTLMGENKNWQHLDLLFLRETSQNSINEIIQTKEGIDFVYKQLMISKKIIETINPNCLIVANSMCRYFLGFEKTTKNHIWMNFDFEFSKDFGTHYILNQNKTPVFFTSMLSGKSALDKGSFRRLQWHIDFVLNHKK